MADGQGIDEGFREFPSRYLERPWSAADAVPADALAGIEMPASLRSFHEQLGACAELLTMYEEIFAAEALEEDDGFLVFADENQSVVSWGFRAEDVAEPDPSVWQRDNTDGEWYDLEKTLLPFLRELFDFTTGQA